MMKMKLNDICLSNAPAIQAKCNLGGENDVREKKFITFFFSFFFCISKFSGYFSLKYIA